MKIELTNQIEEIITNCPKLAKSDNTECKNCVLYDVCHNYWKD